jgi:hypothetical protein
VWRCRSWLLRDHPDPGVVLEFLHPLSLFIDVDGVQLGASVGQKARE